VAMYGIIYQQTNQENTQTVQDAEQLLKPNNQNKKNLSKLLPLKVKKLHSIKCLNTKKVNFITSGWKVFNWGFSIPKPLPLGVVRK